MAARFPYEQFVSPAEVKRAKRMEQRGLGNARLWVHDLAVSRIARFYDCQAVTL